MCFGSQKGEELVCPVPLYGHCMEDRLQISLARGEEVSASPSSASLSEHRKEAVFYEAKGEVVTFRGKSSKGAADELTDSDMQQTDDPAAKSDDGYSSEADTVELLKPSKKKDRWYSSSCYQFCMSYRSPDPDLKVTPFAVILLTILFIIYVLNQADRLMLPVAIPSGLRCEVSVQDECRNGSSVPINGTTPSNESNETNCIHFNDNEQGLLTGR